MYRVLFIGAAGLVGAVAGVIADRVVRHCFSAPALTLSFADLRPAGRGKKRRVPGLQPSHNGPEFLDPEADDR